MKVSFRIPHPPKDVSCHPGKLTTWHPGAPGVDSLKVMNHVSVCSGMILQVDVG